MVLCYPLITGRGPPNQLPPSVITAFVSSRASHCLHHHPRPVVGSDAVGKKKRRNNAWTLNWLQNHGILSSNVLGNGTICSSFAPNSRRIMDTLETQTHPGTPGILEESQKNPQLNVHIGMVKTCKNSWLSCKFSDHPTDQKWSITMVIESPL